MQSGRISPATYFIDDCYLSSFSSGANAALQQQLSEANSALRAKGEECSRLATKRDLLATQLAEQKELLVKSQREAEEMETALLAEFVSERSSWSDKEALLSSGFHEIEDIVDGESLYFLSSSCRLRSCRLLVFD